MDIQYIQVNHVKIYMQSTRLNMYIFHVFIMDISNIHTFGTYRLCIFHIHEIYMKET